MGFKMDLGRFIARQPQRLWSSGIWKPVFTSSQRDVRSESASFMDRIFRGASKPLLVHFAQNAKLTPAEVRELKRLLDQSLKNQP